MSTTAKLMILAVLAVSAVSPVPARADRSALTLEGGASFVATRLSPSPGTGDAVLGSLGGAELRVRYALTNRFEVQATGFWNLSASFVNTSVRATAGAGPVTGDLRRDVGRLGASVGARFIAIGSVWRVPVGLDAGWLQTRFEKQDLLDRSDPQNPVSFGLRIESSHSDRLFVAPFAGVEWLASDHFSVSVLPRLELPIGGSSSPALVIPFTIGWSWYLL
jgi:hypothetical protein